ncbi:hypothetical protein Taro_002856 [Colocasia esculenta]|uniref:Peroxisomal nicotinamide adenine dinucleotide carrier n=1 Tax=Colocasia esculenta TaxID=4460 RepID=A0A843TI75_COLES|nr:hypothetical protein [Colocasia esculenta]
MASSSSSASNAVANGLAGAGGGIIAQIITYPLQTVNTRQQTERISKKKRITMSAVPPNSRDGDGGGGTDGGGREERAARGTPAQILQVIRTEGWGGLYSGLKPSLVGTAASQGIYYYFYQVFKNRAEAIAVARKKKGRGDGTVGMFSWLVVAAIAGSLNVLLTNPIWVLVTRMQTQTQAERKIVEAKREAILREEADSTSADQRTVADKLAELDSIKPRPYGTITAAREVYHEAGIKGFWKGIIPTLIMVCNPSIQFMIYETSLKHLKARSANRRSLENVTALEIFLLGALAKLGATVSTYPLLVVKSRLQAKQEIGGNVKHRYTGTLDAIIKMIRYEGLPSFYKGMSTKIVQSVFAASVLFMMKEELVKLYTIVASKSKNLISGRNKSIHCGGGKKNLLKQSSSKALRYSSNNSPPKVPSFGLLQNLSVVCSTDVGLSRGDQRKARSSTCCTSSELLTCKSTEASQRAKTPTLKSIIGRTRCQSRTEFLRTCKCQVFPLL